VGPSCPLYGRSECFPHHANPNASILGAECPDAREDSFTAIVVDIEEVNESNIPWEDRLQGRDYETQASPRLLSGSITSLIILLGCLTNYATQLVMYHTDALICQVHSRTVTCVLTLPAKCLRDLRGSWDSSSIDRILRYFSAHSNSNPVGNGLHHHPVKNVCGFQTT
jgi:hypothetical protein